jgi:dTMP kinase
MAQGLKGKLITFEGAEGSGKSTQIQMIFDHLQKCKLPVMNLREPGGVKISEAIRNILLDIRHTEMTKVCETLLYMAARAQLVEEVLIPALSKGRIVLCDRFLDSTLVYQGYGNGVDLAFIREMGRGVTQGLQPDLTLLFDIPAEKGLQRRGPVKDRIERKPLAYHRRVRRGYLQLAREESQRIVVIKVNKDKEAIHQIVRRHVDSLLGR